MITARYQQPSPKRTMRIETRVRICVGTSAKSCPPHDVFLACGSDVPNQYNRKCKARVTDLEARDRARESEANGPMIEDEGTRGCL